MPTIDVYVPNLDGRHTIDRESMSRNWYATTPRDVMATERKRATLRRPTSMDASLATYADNYRLHDGKIIGIVTDSLTSSTIVTRWDDSRSGYERALVDMANGDYAHLSDHRPDDTPIVTGEPTRELPRVNRTRARSRRVDGNALHQSRVVHYATIVRAAHYPDAALRNDVPKKFRADVAALLGMDN